MNKGLYFMAFICGAVTGACGAWYVAKNKYEKKEQEAVQSVKERYTVKRPVTLEEALEHAKDKIPSVKKLQDDLSQQEEAGMMEYANKLAKQGYTNYGQTESKEDESNDEEIYIITPDEFGDIEEYDKISLTYYDDEVLVDENDNVIDPDELCVPHDFASHFGEYEDDSVFARNNILKTDYEILMDSRKYYGEIVANKPKDVEVQ